MPVTHCLLGKTPGLLVCLVVTEPKLNRAIAESTGLQLKNPTEFRIQSGLIWACLGPVGSLSEYYRRADCSCESQK